MRRSGSGRPAFNQRTRQHMLETFSPTGLHVLVVDDDPLCLFVLEKMLKECSYRVTTCNEVNRALEILRENDDEFDLVISDVYLPQEDGFRLLEVIGLELDLPVIMISSNADVKVVMKGILHGACDYLIKPVRIEELRNIWQHVMRRRAGHAILRPEMNIDQPDDSEFREEGYRKRKDVLEIPDDRTEDINSSPKRARVNWSQQLHQQFVSAVNQLGIDKAVPKRILQIMNVQGLSRENVASHLQKYRLYLKRLSGVIPAPFPIASFQASDDGTPGGSMLVTQGRKAFEPPATVKGVNLGAGLVLKSGKVQSLDSGTIKSLSQFKFAQQKQAANRAQVLSAIGIGASPSYSSSSQGGLYRMASIDVSTLSAATPDSSPGGPSTKVADELASIKLEEDVVSPTPVLGGLARTQSSMEGCIPHLGAIVGCIKQQGSRSSHPSTTIGSINLQDLAPAIKNTTNEPPSNTNEEGSMHHSLAASLFGSFNVATIQGEEGWPLSNELSFNPSTLQAVQSTAEDLGVIIDEPGDENTAKQRSELSSGSAATEISADGYSDCSFENLIEDLGILPDSQHANLHLLDVDEYLRLD